MGINQLTNMKLLSSCSGGTLISVSNISDAAKLSAESLQKICAAPTCMKPFRKMASSALYKNCVVMYDGKMQNLAEQAEHFVNMCKEGGYGDSVSGSTDGSGEAGSKKDGTEPVVKDEKSNAPFHSFGAAFIAASWFVLALL
ncbi:unnamed protein product [Albugo candida]|uniref:Elicitin n=1 Tax=Albugo candida TaxID=65357 RepID=A0A024GKD2_9STRA|nr:unnamed protein product [Albugo candida]|eukprot:CCI47336.1 unnamed protein product [Albugo candida]